MKSLISIIVLFFCFAKVHPLLESSNDAFLMTMSNTRIIGGLTASQGFFPYVAEIKVSNDIVCAGVIISENWLLTSAWCMSDNANHQLTVRVGGVDRSNPSEPGSYEVAVDRVVMHNDWNTAYINNIALVHVKVPLEFSDVVQAVQITSPSNPIDMDLPATVVGWGGDPYHETLKYNSNFQLIDTSLCGTPITPNSICTNSTSDNPKACNVDRGGPLLQFDSAYKGFVLYGIVSRGTGCVSEYNSLYENIINHTVWIYLVSGV